jgi:hypothetical protein
LTSISRFERSWDTSAASGASWLQHNNNKVLWPLSASGWQDWEEKPVDEIREALWEKASSANRMRKSMAIHEKSAAAELQRRRTVAEKDAKGGAVLDRITSRRKLSDTTEETKTTGHDAV